MDRYERSLRERRTQHDRRMPSFSSTLLDAIYRSIDDECDNREGEMILYRETTRKKHSSGSYNFPEEEQLKEMMNLRRSCRIEKWVEKSGSERARKASDFEDGLRKSHRSDNLSLIFNSTSSSSDSSYGDFSSSEAESVYGCRASNLAPQRPKPIRTALERSEKPPPSMQKKVTHFPEIYVSSSQSKDRQKTKKEGFIKSKSRAASKIYGELKKVKHPISPGGRLASFLNSLFAAGNAKKAKISASEDLGLERKSKSAQASTCSSASSYSRSCLSKSTPSSRGAKSSNGVKRSVRFYPVSIIFDEDCRPYGHKCLYEGDQDPKIGEYPQFIREDLKFQLMEKTKRVEEVAKDILKGYQKKSELLEEVMRDVHEEDYEDDDDDDAASYSSSDLFELENLTAFHTERYREELPVYGTTHPSANRAIANGLIL